jgi:hypothetical protein
VVDIAALPEMHIQSLHLTDIIGTGEQGLTSQYTDDLELNHVKINR